MQYTVDDIKVVSWPEPVRTRPSMYYRHLGNEGCTWLLEAVLESILNTKCGCNANTVEVRYTRHNEVIIEYDGQGMPANYSTEGGIPQPVIYRVLMGLSCIELTEEDIKKYGHLAEIGAIFNAACKVLRIYSVSKDKSYAVNFYKGCISSPLSESSDGITLNKLQFQFDVSVLGEFEISESMLKAITENLQSRYPEKQVKYVD